MVKRRTGRVTVDEWRAISLEAYKNRLLAYEKAPSRCENCESPIPYEKRKNRFCSHSCAAIKNNLGHDRHLHLRHNRNRRECACCGVEFSGKTKRCVGCIENRRNVRLMLSLGKNVSPRRIRVFLIQERGGACQSCGMSEWMGAAIPIEVHHIDGNSLNHSLDNLQILCLNCHAITKNWKHRNPVSARRDVKRKYYIRSKKQ